MPSTETGRSYDLGRRPRKMGVHLFTEGQRSAGGAEFGMRDLGSQVSGQEKARRSGRRCGA
jgi:hypothetical protein